MIKILLIFIFIVLLSGLGYGQAETEINFLWKPAISDTQKFENAVMLVPVQFQSDTITYFLQLDTGATYSSLYSNRLKGIDFPQGHISTSLGEINFRENRHIESRDQQNVSVGTLGVDFLKDKIVVINYENQTIKIDTAYCPKCYVIKPITFLDGRPVLTFDINGENQKLIYDTGSSLFGIWTDKKNWNNLREKNSPISTFPISSWGQINVGFYSKADKIKIHNLEEIVDTEELKVWYVANKKFKRFFRKNDVYGIIGNQPFLKNEVLLDFRRKVFGIKAACSNNYNE